MREGLCSHPAHVQATFGIHFVPCTEAPLTPEVTGGCPRAPLWATSDFVSRSKALGIAKATGVI